MSSKKKVNPNRVPMTAEDRIKRDRDRALVMAWTIMFTVLCDKEGYDSQSLKRVRDSCEYLAQSVAQGRVNVTDMRRVLVEEYGINLKIKW